MRRAAEPLFMLVRHFSARLKISLDRDSPLRPELRHTAPRHLKLSVKLALNFAPARDRKMNGERHGLSADLLDAGAIKVRLAVRCKAARRSFGIRRQAVFEHDRNRAHTLVQQSLHKHVYGDLFFGELPYARERNKTPAMHLARVFTVQRLSLPVRLSAVQIVASDRRDPQRITLCQSDSIEDFTNRQV